MFNRRQMMQVCGAALATPVVGYTNSHENQFQPFHDIKPGVVGIFGPAKSGKTRYVRSLLRRVVDCGKSVSYGFSDYETMVEDWLYVKESTQRNDTTFQFYGQGNQNSQIRAQINHKPFLETITTQDVVIDDERFLSKVKNPKERLWYGYRIAQLAKEYNTTYIFTYPRELPIGLHYSCDIILRMDGSDLPKIVKNNYES